jgi:hypothetical protein
MTGVTQPRPYSSRSELLQREVAGATGSTAGSVEDLKELQLTPLTRQQLRSLAKEADDAVTERPKRQHTRETNDYDSV